jgi:hypothetical protein
VLCYSKGVANRRFPLTLFLLCEIVNGILRDEDPSFPGVGLNWGKRFLEWHWAELKTYWSSPLEYVRCQAVNPANLENFYAILTDLFDKHGFKAWNISGTDESGLLTGVAQKQKVVGVRGKKTQHQKREVKRENTTVIATMCADGTALPPIVIFKGKHYLVKWKQDNPLNASCVTLIY